MKCDVCLTKIPLGQNRCPNCGYVMRPDIASKYNEVSSTHEHITLENVNETKADNVKAKFSKFASSTEKSFKDTFNKETNTRDWYDRRPIKRKKNKSGAFAVIVFAFVIIFTAGSIILGVFGMLNSTSYNILNDYQSFVFDNSDYSYTMDLYDYDGDEAEMDITPDDYDLNDNYYTMHVSASDEDNLIYKVEIRDRTYVDSLSKSADTKNDDIITLADEYFGSDVETAFNKAYNSKTLKNNSIDKTVTVDGEEYNVNITYDGYEIIYDISFNVDYDDIYE